MVKKRSEIASSGYVVQTVEAALWCVHQAVNFSEAVLVAANLGDDADIVAAVTGQIAGAIWGETGIPEAGLPSWLGAIGFGTGPSVSLHMGRRQRASAISPWVGALKSAPGYGPQLLR